MIDESCLCRLCMGKDNVIHNIFDENGNSASDLPGRISVLVNITVRWGDGLPYKICQRCSETLSEWESFKSTCEFSDTAYKKLFSVSTENQVSIKTEPLDTIENSDCLENVGSSSCNHSNISNDILCTSDALCNKLIATVKTEPPDRDDSDECESNNSTIPISNESIVLGSKIIVPDEDNYNPILICGTELEGNGGVNTDKLEIKSIGKNEVSGDENIKSAKQSVRFEIDGVDFNIPLTEPEKCLWCATMHSDLEQLISHIRIHMNKKPFSCPQCKGKFSTSRSFDLHVFQYQNVNNFFCTVCNKIIFCAEEMKHHLQDHGVQKPFVCTLCDKQFSKRFRLKTHIAAHCGEMAYQCPDCGKGLAQPGSLKEHMRIHTGEKPFECHVCKKAFRHRSSYKNHYLIHMSCDSFNCTICSKKFISQRQLSRHLISHLSSSENLKSDLADSTLKNSKMNYVKRHMKKSESNYGGESKKNMFFKSDIVPYSCNLCNKEFTRSCDAKRHAIIHSKEKPFRCTVCQKTFACRNYLTKHSKIHQLKYICTCKLKFYSKKSYLNHLKSHYK